MKITITGNAQMKVADLARKARSLHKPMREATVFMERQTKKRFLTETDPDGAAWADLRPSTIAQKKTSTILREESILVNSVASESGGSVGRVYATAEHGLYHQTGTSKMPAREFLGIGADDEAMIEKIFVAHFDA